MAGKRYETKVIALQPAENQVRRVALEFSILTAVMALAMAVFLVYPAYGASNPHGNFSSETDKCGSCHRMHTSVTSALTPMEQTVALCQSCHSNGQGADTGVMEGVYFDAANPGLSRGVNGGTLLGGGFSLVGNAVPVTGRHRLGEAMVPFGSSTGAAITLSCTDCHTPHTGPNYRLLRRNVNNVPDDRIVSFNIASHGNYTVTDNDPVTPGIQGYTDNYQAGIAGWCTACHSKYMTRGGVWGADPYNAGDAYGYIGRYRHGVEIPITGRTDAANQFSYNLSTDLPLQDIGANGRTDDDTMTCLTCHMAHGTGARMNGSSVLTSAVRGALPSGSDAMLLRTDGRQMCAECHNMI